VHSRIRVAKTITADGEVFADMRREPQIILPDYPPDGD
jgi:hypothetical protein